jgi:predicted O-methyltransferase YrrM
LKQSLLEKLPEDAVDVLRRTRQRMRPIADDIRARIVRDYRMAWPPGHYYSPIPALSYIRAQASRIFAVPSSIPGVELRHAEQLELITQLAAYYQEQPFRRERTSDLRYFFENGAFSYGDALILYSLLRHLRPARVVEVGSGFSSAVMLDTCARFLDSSVEFTFIEPFSTVIDELCRSFADDVNIIRQPVQDVSLSLFQTLTAGDVLFIDSTHVAKAGSDVNFLLFEVLPMLRKGVVVHFHDIFYPFEYPVKWIEQGRSWNEAYVLRAFLMFSDRFDILLWNSFLANFHKATVKAAMPLWGLNTGGSIWLRRI